jgi:hypothetical protein
MEEVEMKVEVESENFLEQKVRHVPACTFSLACFFLRSISSLKSHMSRGEGVSSFLYHTDCVDALIRTVYETTTIFICTISQLGFIPI